MVESLSIEEIRGENITIRLDQIVEIQKEGVSVWKTAGAITIGYLAIGVILTMALLAGI